MADYPYKCFCKGCPHGYESTFYHRPPEWFAERGVTTLPKNCQDCKALIKSFTDEAMRCTSCSRAIRISAKYKISHHKKTGPWEPMSECTRCEQGEKPPVSVERKPRKSRQVQQEPDFGELPSLPVVSYPLNTVIADYQRIIPHEGISRQEHIQHHQDGSGYELTDPEKAYQAGLDRAKSPTALAQQEPTFEGLLRSANVVVQSAATDRSKEYNDAKSSYVVRVTLTDSTRLEVTIFKPNPGSNGHELVTTYDSVTVSEVLDNLDGGKWRYQ